LDYGDARILLTALHTHSPYHVNLVSVIVVACANSRPVYINMWIAVTVRVNFGRYRIEACLSQLVVAVVALW